MDKLNGIINHNINQVIEKQSTDDQKYHYLRDSYQWYLTFNYYLYIVYYVILFFHIFQQIRIIISFDSSKKEMMMKIIFILLLLLYPIIVLPIETLVHDVLFLGLNRPMF